MMDSMANIRPVQVVSIVLLYHQFGLSPFGYQVVGLYGAGAGTLSRTAGAAAAETNCGGGRPLVRLSTSMFN